MATRVVPTAATPCPACADEKSQLRVLRRRHDDLPSGPERPRRVEFECTSGGTLANLAALDVHHTTAMGRCAATTGIVPFGKLVEQVMTREPYASARRMFWVAKLGTTRTASPFDRRYTKDDLNAYLKRLAAREPLTPAA